MTAGFAAEGEVFFAHASSEEGVAGAAESWSSAVCGDVFDDAGGGFVVEQDAGAGSSLEEWSGEDGGGPVGFWSSSEVVEDADAVAVAVPGEAEVELEGADAACEVAHGVGVLGVGVVVRGTVAEVGVEGVDGGAEGAEGGGCGEGGDAVAGVGGDAESAQGLVGCVEAIGEHVEVGGDDVVGLAASAGVGG